MANLTLTGVRKVLGDHVAVDDLTLHVRDGEAVALLGPSGCGKTTTLNMIAGFETPDAGEIMIGDRPMSGMPPDKRNIGYVFQNYALFPHLTVWNNVAFGLRMRGLRKRQCVGPVNEALELVGLRAWSERLPRQLSGGQQQRVALARALAIKPRVLLLDEPLSNLDAKLRQGIREEIVRVHRETGVTMLFVTHDQEEAMAIASRIAVMRDGKIVQVGSPREIYERPVNRFVATFVGRANLFTGMLDAKATGGEMEFAGGRMRLSGVHPERRGRRAYAMVRPERVRVTSGTDSRDVPPPTAENTYPAVVTAATFMGPSIHYRLDLSGVPIEAIVTNAASAFAPRQQVRVSWDPTDVQILADAPLEAKPGGETDHAAGSHQAGTGAYEEGVQQPATAEGSRA